eukprot:scaffold136173_cov17-Tisochrysis_lutea.AAC.3
MPRKKKSPQFRCREQASSLIIDQETMVFVAQLVHIPGVLKWMHELRLEAPCCMTNSARRL